jgi:enterochelin esterase-like enzyme
MIVRLGTAVAAALLLASTVTASSLAAPAAGRTAVAHIATGQAGTVARASLPLTTYAGGSTVVEDDLYSPTLELHTSYRVMLPPDYHASARRYPVLYMLHGVAGDSSEWQSIGLLEAADRMIQRGEIDPFLIVLPNGGAHYWVNQATGARWADYVAQDVVRQIDQGYRTVAGPQGRAIGGLSMGGEGALRIALKNPSVFGTAAAHSPSLRTAFDQFAPELQPLFGDEMSWRTMTPLWLVLDSDTGYGLNLALDVGEDDPWRANVELLHERMLARGMAHRFEVLPGEHAAEYWIDNVDQYLTYYSSALAGSAQFGLVTDAY